MKKYTFDLGSWHIDEIFAPIRKKTDVVKLLMKTLKIMIAGQPIGRNSSAGQLVLVVSKMSRLFYFSENRYISINFPFAVTEAEDRKIYSSKHVSDIDSEITSHVLSVIGSRQSFESDNIIEFADPIISIADSNSAFWAFLKDLLLYEDGYVRYDHDEAHANERLHPLHHYDVFYSSGATFKIGLKGRLGRESIIDFLSIESDCHFLDGASKSASVGSRRRAR